LFKSADEAAAGGEKVAYPKSQKQHTEWGGRVFKLKDLYSYTGPFTRNLPTTVNVDAGVTGTGSNLDAHHPTLPPGTENAGEYHTHLQGERFSEPDMQRARMQGIPAYVATPSGKILRYDPQTRRSSIIRDTLVRRR